MKHLFHLIAPRRELLILIKMAAPLVGAQLLQIAMGVIDTVMAGQLGAEALAAIAMGSAVWFFVVLVGIGLMRVMPTNIAQSRGRQDFPAIREELRQGFWLALGLGVCSVAALLLAASQLSLLDVDPAVIPATQDYLYWIAWSLPFSCLYLVPRYFNEGMGHTVPMLWIQLLLLPLNILGNWVFMFGNLGVAPMGAAGAALSTGLAQTLGAVLIACYTFFGPRYRAYELRKRMTGPNWAYLWANVKLGVPIAVSLGMEAGMFTLVTLLMGRFGVEAVASHQIALNVASCAFMVPLGISMALTIRVGESLGAGERQQALQRAHLGIGLCMSVCCLSAATFILLGSSIAALYTSEPRLIALATELLVFAAWFQVVDGLQIGATGSLLGYRDTKVPMLLSVVCFWGGGLSVGIGSSVFLGYGPHGLWLGLVVGLGLAALAMNTRLLILGKRADEENIKQHRAV